MIRLYTGFDPRESIGWHVFCSSVLQRCSGLVSIIPLLPQYLGLPAGSNAFTYSRFLVPFLCGFKGRAIFVDGCDMLALGDLDELDQLFDMECAVQVVQHADYETRHPWKYLGTPMVAENRNYRRKNWASLMLMNCAHPAWASYTPAKLMARIEQDRGLEVLALDDLPPAAVGELPAEWNVLVDEGQPAEGAKLLHWTAGMPGFEAYDHAPGAQAWHDQRRSMERGHGLR